MKRDSTTIFVESESGNPDYPCITPVPWNGLPVWDGFTGSTLLVIKAAYERDKNNIVVTPNPVPQVQVREIDARRLRLALRKLGKLSAIKSAITNLGEDAEINWEYATMIREDNPLVIALSSQLSLNINTIFNEANSFI